MPHPKNKRPLKKQQRSHEPLEFYRFYPDEELSALDML